MLLGALVPFHDTGGDPETVRGYAQGLCHVGGPGSDIRQTLMRQVEAATAASQASKAWLRRIRWVLAVIRWRVMLKVL